jgi:hypothetical protein
MTVFSRVADILQAKTHKLLDQLEDPNETLDLSYEKMITGLQQTKLHLADVVAQQKSLERQIEAAQQEAAKAEDDARLALQAGREDLAKEGVKRQSPQCRHVARRSQMRLAVRHCVRERAGPGGSRKRATASTGKRNRKFADSPLEGSGFELPVRGSGEAGLSPLLLAPIAWDGSACCGSALFFIDIDRLTPSL